MYTNLIGFVAESAAVVNLGFGCHCLPLDITFCGIEVEFQEH